MQKSSQGSCLLYTILPAVQRCSNKTKHTAEERITAQQNCSMAEFFPGEELGGIGAGIGSPSLRSCWAHETGQQDPGAETLLADGYFRWFILRNVLRTAHKNPQKHSSSQRIDIFCRYVYILGHNLLVLYL